MTDDKRDRAKQTWRPPTRRVFIGMIATAAAALAVKPAPAPEPVRSTWNGKTRWIGHC